MVDDAAPQPTSRELVRAAIRAIQNRRKMHVWLAWDLRPGSYVAIAITREAAMKAIRDAGGDLGVLVTSSGLIVRRRTLNEDSAAVDVSPEAPRPTPKRARRQRPQQ